MLAVFLSPVFDLFQRQEPVNVQTLHHNDHIILTQSLSNLGRQTFLIKIIDYNQRKDPTTIEQIISHEVSNPTLSHRTHIWTRSYVHGEEMSAGTFRPQIQTFLTQKNINALNAVTNMGFYKKFPNVQDYGQLRLPNFPAWAQDHDYCT